MILKKKAHKKIGLALGGGIAKGLAHIGVLKVFKREGIPVDYIAGSSIGALVGGWYALHGGVDAAEELFLKLKFLDLFPLKEAILGGSKQGPWKGEAVRKLLTEQFRDARIEDARIPFVAIATDAETGNEVLIGKGNMADAIRASIAAPALFDSSLVAGRRMIDGSFSNPFPVDRVRELGADVVIGVDLTYFPKSALEKRGSIARAYRGVSDTVMFLQHQLTRRISPPADIMIRPPLEEIDWFAFGRAAEIIKIGEEEAERHIKAIRRKAGL